MDFPKYSWAPLVAQFVKSLPAMRETWIQSLDWEDPLEKGKATHSSILAWVPRSWIQLRDFYFSLLYQFSCIIYFLVFFNGKRGSQRQKSSVALVPHNFAPTGRGRPGALPPDSPPPGPWGHSARPGQSKANLLRQAPQWGTGAQGTLAWPRAPTTHAVPSPVPRLPPPLQHPPAQS